MQANPEAIAFRESLEEGMAYLEDLFVELEHNSTRKGLAKEIIERLGSVAGDAAALRSIIIKELVL